MKIVDQAVEGALHSGVCPSPTQRYPEGRFEYAPFEGLFVGALRDVVDGRLDVTVRAAAARAIAFLLREQVVTEAVATDVLGAAWKALDVSKVVRALVVGLRLALGDHEKIAEWTKRIAGRAHAGRHLDSFVSAMGILVGLRDFHGGLPASWQLSLIRALETTHLQWRLFLLADDYARRFGSEPQWVNTIRARRIIEAHRRATRPGEVADSAKGAAT